MKVILLQELKGRGGEGDVIEVAAGFANNYLIPQGIAVVATKGNLKQLDQRKHNIASREEKRLSEATALKAKLEAEPIVVEAKVGEEGVLFGSVTNVMIAEAVKKHHGIELDRKRIELGHLIKTAGEHEVHVSLYREIKAALKLLVASAEDIAARNEKAEEEVVELQNEAAVDSVTEESAE